MKIGTVDVEADGLLDEATTMWCASIKDHDTGAVTSFYPDGSGSNYIPAFLKALDELDVAIGHNIIKYDLALLRKLFGYNFKGKIVDTLLMSRVQRPKRKLPPHCPRRTGPHSVEAWGFRLGRGKVDHEDWSQFSPEMLKRNQEDVEIQYLIYKALLREGKGEGWRDAHRLNFQLFDLLQRQEEYGWLVDRKHLDHCVYFLDRWIDRIDRAVESHLPLVVEINETKKEGVYNYVRKPFLKSGAYSRSVTQWYGDGESAKRAGVAGPFARIDFRRTNLDSNLETKRFLIDLGWQPEQWNTNNAGERTSPKLSKEDPFEGIQGSLGRLIAKRVQCRHRKSVLLGYVKLIRPDGRIPAIVTGLADTSRAKHAGIVNVPTTGAFFGKLDAEVFHCKDRDGSLSVRILLATKRGQLAARMGDEESSQTLFSMDRRMNGTDFHSVNQRILGLPFRKNAKDLLLLLYLWRWEIPKLARMLGMFCRTKPSRYKATSTERKIPGLGNLLDNAQKEWRATAKQRFNPKFGRMEWYDGKITGLDGRPIVVASEHKILGYYLQSDEAIQMAIAYVMFHKWMEKKGYVLGLDFGTLCWYHDEIQVECPPELAHVVGETCAHAIAWAGEFLKIPVPHKGEYKIGNNWSESH